MFNLFSFSAAGFPDNVATYSVVSGLWASVLALGLFIGPSVAGYLFDSVGFQWGSIFVVGAGALLIITIIGFLLFSDRTKHDASSSSSETSETEPLIGENGIRDISEHPSSYGATHA
jgi:MFS family permease